MQKQNNWSIKTNSVGSIYFFTSGHLENCQVNKVKQFLFDVKFIRKWSSPFLFYLPDPSTMQNMSFKGIRRVMPGETINITSI